MVHVVRINRERCSWNYDCGKKQIVIFNKKTYLHLPVDKHILVHGYYGHFSAASTERTLDHAQPNKLFEGV